MLPNAEDWPKAEPPKAEEACCGVPLLPPNAEVTPPNAETGGVDVALPNADGCVLPNADG